MEYQNVLNPKEGRKREKNAKNREQMGQIENK